MAEVKPIFHIPIPENKTLDLDQCTMTFNIAAKVAKTTDAAILQACVEFAHGTGITDLYLIDEDFALNALKKQIPMEPISTPWQWDVSHYCPTCRNPLGAPTVDMFHNGSYCDRCGQKIKWGDCSD